MTSNDAAQTLAMIGTILTACAPKIGCTSNKMRVNHVRRRFSKVPYCNTICAPTELVAYRALRVHTRR